MTFVVQIGNSDDKLTQQEWASFIFQIENSIKSCYATIHFFGTSPGHVAWQNACWVFELNETTYKWGDHLKKEIIKIRKHFKQDSVAWMQGETEFI